MKKEARGEGAVFISRKSVSQQWSKENARIRKVTNRLRASFSWCYSATRLTDSRAAVPSKFCKLLLNLRSAATAQSSEMRLRMTLGT